jgi:hypothetical protein
MLMHGGADSAMHRSMRGSAIGCRDCVHVRRTMRRAKRPLHCGYARVAVVNRSEIGAISRCDSLVSALCARFCNAMSASSDLRPRWTNAHSAATAVKARTRATYHVSTDDGPVREGVPDHRAVHVDDRGVVAKDAA